MLNSPGGSSCSQGVPNQPNRPHPLTAADYFTSVMVWLEGKSGEPLSKLAQDRRYTVDSLAALTGERT